MAEAQQVYPLADGYARSDAEAATTKANSKELRSQKRKKWLLYGILFVIFQTGIIVLFSLTIMKVRTPKFRIQPFAYDTLMVGPSTPEFATNMNVQFAVKNTNFGPYKYDSTKVYFYYDDIQVGSAVIPKSKANFRSTQKFSVPVNLTSANIPSNSNLANDLSRGNLPLTSKSTLSGKVELMLIFKKKKTVDLSCTMDVTTKNKELQNVNCQ